MEKSDNSNHQQRRGSKSPDRNKDKKTPPASGIKALLPQLHRSKSAKKKARKPDSDTATFNNSSSSQQNLFDSSQPTAHISFDSNIINNSNTNNNNNNNNVSNNVDNSSLAEKSQSTANNMTTTTLDPNDAAPMQQDDDYDEFFPSASIATTLPSTHNTVVKAGGFIQEHLAGASRGAAVASAATLHNIYAEKTLNPSPLPSIFFVPDPLTSQPWLVKECLAALYSAELTLDHLQFDKRAETDLFVIKGDTLQKPLLYSDNTLIRNQTRSFKVKVDSTNYKKNPNGKPNPIDVSFSITGTVWGYQEALTCIYVPNTKLEPFLAPACANYAYDTWLYKKPDCAVVGFRPIFNNSSDDSKKQLSALIMLCAVPPTLCPAFISNCLSKGLELSRADTRFATISIFAVVSRAIAANDYHQALLTKFNSDFNLCRKPEVLGSLPISKQQIATLNAASPTPFMGISTHPCPWNPNETVVILAFCNQADRAAATIFLLMFGEQFPGEPKFLPVEKYNNTKDQFTH